MAETALGMATTLVAGAVSVASSAAREEMSLLLGVRDDIWFINDELKMMQAFLRAADGARENTGVLKAYLDLIRDMACDIEDCLEEFMVFIKHKNFVKQLLSLKARHRIAAQIRALKQRVQEMSQRNLRYNLIKLTPSTSSAVTGDTELARNFTALNVEDAQLVGLDEPKKKLIELITKLKEPIEHETRAGPRVVSLVGMGGIGKTALTKKVYDSKDFSDMFGTRAWITVSQSFDQKELFKEMIMQLFGSESWNKLLEKHKGQVLEGHLVNYLSKKLKETRRYLIILDDVWTIDAWDRIKITFQDSGKDDNCVVVTTRNGKLAEYCSHPSNIHHPEFLGKEEATTLFLKKTNKRLDDLEKDDNTKVIVDKILNKCGGLPLAILTIGGLLANKDTEEWESIYKQLPSDLATNRSLDALRRVVSLSYSHLPSHLKPCFLHLSIFPEDFEVEKEHLVNRWVAEGFITDDSATRTLEEVSENYFYELISRCMIQPSKFDNLGKVKTCRIHDIVHDIAVSISRQENYVFILGESTSNITTRVGIRHLSCVASRKLNTGMDLSRVRSLTVFSEPLEPISLFFSSKFKMLRILDLKKAPFTIRQKHISNIGLLLHLKYLHFPTNGSDVYALPRSVGNLRGLVNLDVRNSDITTLPVEITKLQDLRSLRCSNTYTVLQKVTETTSVQIRYSSGCRMPRGIGSFKELQILEDVDIDRTSWKAIKELRELTQLRKLVVTGRGPPKKKCEAFCEAASNLSSLRSLNVSTKQKPFKDAGMLDMLVSFPSSLPSLERLKLTGPLQEVPSWIGKSVKLVKIDLMFCELKELDALAELPNLLQLRLYFNAYGAEKLVFRRDAFAKLRILHLHNHYYMALREVTFEQSTSPNLEEISIYNCRLTSGITGIEHLPKLKEIDIWGGTLANQDLLKEEADKHMNHPVLRIQDCEETDVKVEVRESISEAGESSQS